MTRTMNQIFEFIGNYWWLVAIWAGFMIALLLDNRSRSGLSVSPSQATSLINREGAVVVDIRDKKDFKSGHMSGAINIPFGDLAKRLGELEPHKGKPVVLVCKTGNTVSMASKMLKEKGFNAVRLAGGMMEWNAQNLPVVRK